MSSKRSTSEQEHLVISQYDAYHDRALTEAEAIVYRQHFDTCAKCRTWVENQESIAQQLVNEAPAPANLSPAAAARIQKNVFGKMRRALIMNNVRTVSGAALAFAVLAVVVGICVWQSRTLDAIDLVGEVIPEVDADVQVTPELEAVAPVSDEQLIEAVYAKEAAEIERLLVAGANADAIDYRGDPILKAAIMQGNTETTRLLVENGADVNAKDKDENALLGTAAYRGELEIVRIMLDAGADANATMKTSETGLGVPTGINVPVLQEAVLGNNSDIVELLIAQGADVNQAEGYLDRTPLHGAAWFNYADIVQILLNHGADPNKPSSYEEGETPLFFAVRNGGVESAQALLDGGAAIDFQTERGWTPLISLAANKTVRRDLRGKLSAFLLDKGADLNLGDRIGNTALHYAAREGLTNVIRILIENGASVDLQNNVGNTALHEAAKWGQTKAITLLIENGASLDLQNDKGQTALDVAIDDNVIELLQEARVAD